MLVMVFFHVSLGGSPRAALMPSILLHTLLANMQFMRQCSVVSFRLVTQHLQLLGSFIFSSQLRLGRTLLLPWVFLVKPCFRLVGKLLPKSFLFLDEELTLVLMKFVLRFLFWTYFMDKSNAYQTCHSACWQ
jgi:hypothetical protein